MGNGTFKKASLCMYKHTHGHRDTHGHTHVLTLCGILFVL